MIGRLIGGILVALGMFAGSAQAESLRWQFRSFDSKVVDVKFFSSNRNHVWPSRDTVYTIKNYDVQTYNLSCISGEKICFGAWRRGNDSKYWGAGHTGKKACSTCCYICNGTPTKLINLNE